MSNRSEGNPAVSMNQNTLEKLSVVWELFSFAKSPIEERRDQIFQCIEVVKKIKNKEAPALEEWAAHNLPADKYQIKIDDCNSVMLGME